MRETFGIAATSWKGFQFDGPRCRGDAGTADGRARPAAEGTQAPAVPGLRARPALGLLRPGRSSREGPRVLLATSRRPSATTSARSPGTSRRSSPTAKSASAATSRTTSSATCGGSPSARSGRARRPGDSARSSPRSRSPSAPAAAATTSTASGSARRQAPLPLTASEVRVRGRRSVRFFSRLNTGFADIVPPAPRQNPGKVHRPRNRWTIRNWSERAQASSRVGLLWSLGVIFLPQQGSCQTDSGTPSVSQGSAVAAGVWGGEHIRHGSQRQRRGHRI